MNLGPWDFGTIKIGDHKTLGPWDHVNLEPWVIGTIELWDFETLEEYNLFTYGLLYNGHL
jgi:hypothetical protein